MSKGPDESLKSGRRREGGNNEQAMGVAMERTASDVGVGVQMKTYLVNGIRSTGPSTGTWLRR